MMRHPRAEHGFSSAVSSVMFCTGGGREIAETRGGSYIYAGDAQQFHEWEFRTRLKLHRNKDPDRYSEAMSRVVDGLRGVAFTIAHEVGLAQRIKAQRYEEQLERRPHQMMMKLKMSTIWMKKSTRSRELIC